MTFYLLGKCGRFGVILWPFSFVAVLVEAVLVCGRFGCTPCAVARWGVRRGAAKAAAVAESSVCGRDHEVGLTSSLELSL